VFVLVSELLYLPQRLSTATAATDTRPILYPLGESLPVLNSLLSLKFLMNLSCRSVSRTFTAFTTTTTPYLHRKCLSLTIYVPLDTNLSFVVFLNRISLSRNLHAAPCQLRPPPPMTRTHPILFKLRRWSLGYCLCSYLSLLTTCVCSCFRMTILATTTIVTGYA
jgi:hypothetical protein